MESLKIAHLFLILVFQASLNGLKLRVTQIFNLKQQQDQRNNILAVVIKEHEKLFFEQTNKCTSSKRLNELIIMISDNFKLNCKL